MNQFRKYVYILFGLTLTVYVLIVAKVILVPFSFALVFAMLLHPVCGRMERWKFPRGLAVIVSMIGLLLIIAGIIWFVSSQVSKIAKNLNDLGTRIMFMIDEAQHKLKDIFGVEETAQTEYMRNAVNDTLANSSSFLQDTLMTTTGFFTSFILFTLSLFFLLYYSHFFKTFLFKLVQNNDQNTVEEILYRQQKVVQNYIVGLFTVMAIVAVLNSVGLLIIGIEYAIFWGILAALLTIIPFVGVFIGSVLPILFALVTTDSLWYPVSVMGVFWFVQFMEANFITPNIVGGRVSINPFAAVLALFVGGAIWGPAGMILFIPFIAILKVVFDAIGPLQPYGYLLGDPHAEMENPLVEKIKQRLKRD